MTLSKEEINAIMSLAAKIIMEQEKNKSDKAIRESEDFLDLTDVRAPEKCPDCND
tara:strand:- start:167 stop:331 length:165 start_codon:yes stop_codon:yes gene_type:complete